MQNARLDKGQAGVQFTGRNISNLRYADDTTLMVESEEELKNLLMKVKEESEKAGLKLNFQKNPVLRCTGFSTVQLSHPNMTIGKTRALTGWIFVGKVMSLLLNMLSTLVIAFLPRSKHFLISWLQSPSAVILELNKMKSVTVSIVSPSICHEELGLAAMIFVFLKVEF